MNRYRVLLPVTIDGEYGQGDEFEKDLSEEEEAGNLQSGLLEIVPATYKVLLSRLDFGDAAADPGETLTVALTVAQQRHLIGGGFIEPLPDKPKAAKKKEA